MARTLTLRQRRYARAVAAFTLIEVLMSIFVLALGLLGLGALIPGIIREQRVASDRTLGIIVANDAEAYLRTRADLQRLFVQPAGGGPTFGTAIPTYGLGTWLLSDEWSETYGWDLRSIDKDELEGVGDVLLDQDANGIDPVRIPLADRLYPSPASNLDAPQFVWDFVARRLPPIDSDGYALLADIPYTLPATLLDQLRAGVEVAVFVRRVDTGIRVPAGDTAYSIMLQPSNPVLPVGLGEDDLPTGAGARTGDREIYAAPLTLRASYDGERTSVLTLSQDGTAASDIPGSDVGLPEQLLLATQIGQQLVDNLGNIYTVEEVLELDDSGAEVRIRPSIERWISQTDGQPTGFDDERGWTQINQVVFVPQPPASTFVFRIGVEPEAVRSPSGSGAGRLPL
ncbi:MAG: hypothetical protein HRU13_12380 [Phycisphaerales bacterium]|nr:hypothetical protein [Phycisphaerales bacterium]